MNILSGISMAAAGVGFARKALGALGADKPKGPAGQALAKDYRFSRGFLNWKQEPALHVIRSVEDLIQLYLETAPSPRPGDVPLHRLPKEEVDRLAVQRAREDWASGRFTPQQLPGYKPQDPASEVVVWDVFARTPASGRASVERSNGAWLVDALGRHYFKKASDFTAAERNLKKATAEFAGQRARFNTLLQQYRATTGREYDLDSCEVSAAPLCAEISKQAEAIQKALLKAQEYEDEIQATLTRNINEEMLKSAERYKAQLEAEGETGIVVLSTGVLKAKRRVSPRSLAVLQQMEARELAERRGKIPQREELPTTAVEEAERLARYRTEGQKRRLTEMTSGGKIRTVTREFVPGPREKSTRKKPLRRNPHGIQDGIDGMDGAAGIMAPNVALVDGLGMTPGTATLGIGSLVLLGAGAFIVYRVVQGASRKAA